MRLRKEVEYSLISLTALGEGQVRLSASELSHRLGISRSLLAKLLQRLQRGGLVEAERGYRGGYRLRRSLETITVQEVIETLRGTERLAPCLEGDPCPRLDSCSIRRGVASLQGLFDTLLGSLTLAQLAGRGGNAAPDVEGPEDGRGADAGAAEAEARA